MNNTMKKLLSLLLVAVMTVCLLAACGGEKKPEQPTQPTLEHIDYHRVLFGTDAPILSNIWELSRLLSEDIPDEALIAILGQNAKELFGF